MLKKAIEVCKSRIAVEVVATETPIASITTVAVKKDLTTVASDIIKPAIVILLRIRITEDKVLVPSTPCLTYSATEVIPLTKASIGPELVLYIASPSKIKLVCIRPILAFNP